MSFLHQFLNDSSVIDFIVFRDTVEDTRTFFNPSEMIEYIRSIDYDGATNLGSLKVSNMTNDLTERYE